MTQENETQPRLDPAFAIDPALAEGVTNPSHLNPEPVEMSHDDLVALATATKGELQTLKAQFDKLCEGLNIRL